MHILGCLSILLLFAVIFIFSLVRGFFSMLFGWGRTKSESASRQHSYTTSEQERGNSTRSSSNSSISKKKVIDKDEGEYVDFEEIDNK